LSLGVTFQVKHLCVGDFASFAKIFAGFYFGRGIEQNNLPGVAIKYMYSYHCLLNVGNKKKKGAEAPLLPGFKYF
jgi:hypothetical protein